ncbi:hypothetical protein G8764_05685 [Pseudomaricurvus alcaniphilus]|uniref:cupin domain-containing protein n=1 Tax=Pseudomaricurvus alcaniphilus TaxID=1166482 RepID=UPI001407ED81|nr:hypothetical protein [Pseudomaricurvus alcaniphilus]NHN36782.1 hypothetical protein [Pseudomaricurvus alcaniphilus]
MIKASGIRFELDYSLLQEDPALAGIAADLHALPAIDSPQSFNDFCQAACRLWQQHFPNGRGATANGFQEMSARLALANPAEEIVTTAWGGVVITRRDEPLVEKYLVINQGHYLALEKHDEKMESLFVIEGRGLILRRERTEASLLVEELQTGKKFYFTPGVEHCVIGTENLLIFERSLDPKGMDQDLLFLYNPDSSV